MNDKKRILLVEDDPNFGIILRDFLKMNDYDVVLAKNGMEGFEKFKKHDFHICILDVMMPYKDGFTLAEAAEVCIYPFFDEDGGVDSERTFMKQVVQKYCGETEESEDLFNAEEIEEESQA